MERRSRSWIRIYYKIIQNRFVAGQISRSAESGQPRAGVDGSKQHRFPTHLLRYFASSGLNFKMNEISDPIQTKGTAVWNAIE